MELFEIAEKMRERRFIPHVCASGEQAAALAVELVNKRSVGIGGSATVRDMGLADMLSESGCEVHWHWLAAAEKKQSERDAAMAAGVYISSANAVLEDGRLLNIEGTGNRIAGLTYGPQTVIVIAGRNKIVKTVDDGIERTKRDCCPANARRLGMRTPCTETGSCSDCRSEARMCCLITIHEAPTRRVKDFHVILVNEDMGL